MTEAVTLKDPQRYFLLLDQAAGSHWWGCAIEYVERKWLMQAIWRTSAKRRASLDWLDIGCGTGTRLRKWANWGCWGRRVGIEPEAEAIQVAKMDSSLEVHAGHLPHLPNLHRQFHVITAFDVLQHVEQERRAESVREMAGLLADGGILLLRTNAPAIGSLSDGDVTIVDPGWLRREIEAAGFEVVRTSRFNACGGLAEDFSKLMRRNRERKVNQGPLRTGLPHSWNRRPGGHFLAGACGYVESRILGTGVVNFPIGHSYLMMAIKDGDHERSAISER